MERLSRRAVQIAIELKHPVYDCFYLALAESASSRVVTADRRMITRTAGTKWSRLVRRLGDRSRGA